MGKKGKKITSGMETCLQPIPYGHDLSSIYLSVCLSVSQSINQYLCIGLCVLACACVCLYNLFIYFLNLLFLMWVFFIKVPRSACVGPTSTK